MVWNLTQPEVKPKLTVQDFQVGDRVRVLQDTQPVWREPGIPAGTELEVVRAGSFWVGLKDPRQNYFVFYDLAVVGPPPGRGRLAAPAKRTLDNLAKVE